MRKDQVREILVQTFGADEVQAMGDEQIAVEYAHVMAEIEIDEQGY